MGIKIRMPGTILRKYTRGREVVEVNGNTVGECLRDLVTCFPDIKPELFQESGLVMSEVSIFVNGKILYTKDLDKPVDDDDEISIIPIVMGG